MGATIPMPPDTFDEDLSSWPAILAIKDSLAAMSPEEQRRQKLEVGTNWPPRTSTAKPFSDGLFSSENERTGYMFFQGPTPLTGIQMNRAGFFEELKQGDFDVPKILFVFIALGGVSGVALLAALVAS